MISNRQISVLFNTLAELMLLHGGNEEEAKSFSSASYRLRRMSQDVLEMNINELNENFNKKVIPKIIELKKNGSIEIFDELVQLTPSGIFEIMRLKGLGGKKISMLWKQAGIDSIDELLKACKSKKVSRIKGFGEKTEKNIIAAIEQYRENKHLFHFATVEDEAENIVELLRKVCQTDKISLCGEVRRKCNVIERIELVAAVNPKKILTNKAVLRFLIIESSSTSEVLGHTINEIPFTIYFTSPEKYYHELFIRTGNEPHVQRILRKVTGISTKYESEEAIYTKAGLPFIIPELRENVAEMNFNSKKQIAQLIADEDIKGVVHNHTTWSDGIDSMEDFVVACIKRKFQYAVISEHSKNAHYAGGMKEEKFLKQLHQIDLLNQRFSPFKIFKSVECDILVSGELDFSNQFLKCFDMVIVSIHQLLRMDEEKATKRLLKAIENPFTTILGHMTGRQLLIRPGYPANVKKVIDACARNNVIIELNANPYRLDMDWTYIPYALKKGVMISINPDAHSIGEIENIHWGVVSARKGGLTKEMTWNAMPLKGIEEWLIKYR